MEYCKKKIRLQFLLCFDNIVTFDTIKDLFNLPLILVSFIVNQTDRKCWIAYLLLVVVNTDYVGKKICQNKIF